MMCYLVLATTMTLYGIGVISSVYMLRNYLFDQSMQQLITSSLSGQNGRHFPDDIFRCILVNEMRFYIAHATMQHNLLTGGPKVYFIQT